MLSKLWAWIKGLFGCKKEEPKLVIPPVGKKVTATQKARTRRKQKRLNKK